MSRRALAVTGAALAASVAVAVPAALAAKGGGATLEAVNGQKIVINKMAADTSHFSPGTVSIRSGATLSIVDKGGVPHTFSLVRKSELPANAKQVNNCLRAVCGDIAKAHGADPNSEAPPKKLSVDVGAKGFDQAGDSVFFAGNTKVKITAKKGSTLYFLCAIHPWMQGKVVVR